MMTSAGLAVEAPSRRQVTSHVMRDVPIDLRQHPFRGARRIAVSEIRRRVPRWAMAKTAFGNSTMEVDLHTAGGRSLYRYRYLETRPQFQLLRRLLKPGDVFIDAGANIGLYTLTAADLVGPTGHVIAIEPAPLLALRRNVELNGYNWVTFIDAALGDITGRRNFTMFEGEGCGMSSFAPIDLGGSLIEVDVCRLDDLVPDNLFDRIRLVKIDVEGAEVATLRGAPRLLRETKAHFLVEVEPPRLERQGATPEELYEFFAGFEAHPFPSSPDVWFARA
jgi:FkbM family methyltransferase